MHIVLATGIFPPEIGGPATYSAKLAEELLKLGHRVTVVTYGKMPTLEHEQMKIVFVSTSGTLCTRWRRYAKALSQEAGDADVVIAFSSVSTGIPLMLAGLPKPKKILRLGGEFFWERYTDSGGMMSLRQWHASKIGFWRIVNACFMEPILQFFDCVVYSTEFQRQIHATIYTHLPRTEVIENARPALLTPRPSSSRWRKGTPFRLLFMGRFVGFKNLFALLDAVATLPDCTLTLVGSGFLKNAVGKRASMPDLHGRVLVREPVRGAEKESVFTTHDLLVLPSVTEISPNTALEAVSAGLPVLLTEETGLQETGMIRLRSLRTADQIAIAIRASMDRYADFHNDAKIRTYAEVAKDWLLHVSSLL